ncbi:MAG: tRNA epoxyqueuosine(34) reductase QueG [Pyrinomonadaceae bacterium]
MVSLTQQIKERAIDLGFAKVGIARAEGLSTESGHLNEWLARGYQGEMAWMEREPQKRADPRLLMPDARSVVVVALNYFTDYKHDEDAGQGKISRYAWGDDYHDVFRDKLKLLLEWIQSREPETQGKLCVDTAPMMDKAWGVRGGLGWIGKHSNLITKEIGSWVFIGSLVLNLELAYETELVEDHCGTCTMCLEACPTGAIVEPYVVDSRRCISYATIELRDETLPPLIAENQNGWLYGCDICQDVCPWNRFEEPTEEARFEPRLGDTSLDLHRLAAMDHDEYVGRFRRSAIKRTKLSGLKRNARSLEKAAGGV